MSSRQSNLIYDAARNDEPSWAMLCVEQINSSLDPEISIYGFLFQAFRAIVGHLFICEVV